MTSIYVVEDEYIIALNIKKQLKDLNYHCLGHSADAEDALVQIEKHKPDLVLMDIELGSGMNGIQAASHIRDNFDIPVVFLTAYADEQTLKAATLAQPFGYILKPFNGQELNSTIVTALYQKKMKDELQLRDKQLSGIISAIDDPLILCDFEGRVLFCNDAADNMFSLKGLEFFFFEDHLIDVVVEYQKLYSPAKSPHLYLDYQKVNIQTNNSVQCVHFFKNVSESIEKNIKLIRNQKQLHESQKIEALGRLAGGVAHDFNNYLAVILGYIKIMMEDVPANSEVFTGLKEIEHTTKKAAGLTRQLLTLARNHKGSVKRTDVAALLKDNFQIISKVLPRTISFEFTDNDTSQYAFIDPDLFLTAILNLVINARDSIGQNGEITLHIEDLVITDAKNCITGTLHQGRYTVVRIKDSGKGIPHNIQNTIFDPFFTTKSMGNGLGLSNLHSLILQWNGHIELVSEPGKGAEFILYLSQSLTKDDKAYTNEVDLQEESTRVLLVEPDSDLQLFYSSIIRKLGCEVNVCSNAGEAFLLFDENPLDYCLLITDIIMPRISGLLLAEKLKLKTPQMNVLFTSSYDLDDLSEIISLPDEIEIISKSCSEEEFINKLHSIEPLSLLH